MLTTLAEAETPIAGGLDSEKFGSEKYGLLENDGYKDKKMSTAAQAKPHYVTSNVRATLRHLNAEAGDLSTFRGIGTKTAIYLLTTPIGIALEFGVDRLVKSIYLANALKGFLCSLIIAQCWAALVHVVISKPRYKFWFRRLPLSWFGVMRRVWISVLVSGLSEEVMYWAFRYFASSSKPKDPTPKAANDKKHFSLSQGPMVQISLAIVLWAFLKGVLRSQAKALIRMALSKPFHAIETRVYASMLPDDEDPVVPLDRSFQGQPQSGGILQQQPQPLSFADAARSIDKQTYLRLLKLDIKLHCIKQAIEWAFWTLVFAEVVYMIGPSAVWVVFKLICGTPVVQTDLDRVQGNVTRSILDNLIAGPKNVTSPAFNVTITD